MTLTNIVRVTRLPFSLDKPVRLLISISDEALEVVNRRFPNVPDIFLSNITDEYFQACEIRGIVRRDAIDLVPLLEIVGRTDILEEITAKTLPVEPKKRML